ncbi:MAG: RIP metalloprotease RseP [Acidobacteriia bacterium]|nr:RIP metalloprotease RseP [Terriglobia bacterium]
MSYLIYPAATAVVLGILVFVHEFGHYAVAKLCGVRVEVFSLGFGKRLLGFTRGNTDYRLSLLPIGGYVKMAGENPLESRSGDPGEFMSHPRWQRFLIAIAGPAMNILLAIGVLTGVYMHHYEHPAYLEQPTSIATVIPNSAAEKAGLKPGDLITRVADLNNPTWEQLIPKVLLNPNQPVEMTIQRAGQTLEVTVTPQAAGAERMGDAGILPLNPVLVASLTDLNSPAAKAGIKPGDQILTIGGSTVNNMTDLVDDLQRAKDSPTEIKVLREKKELAIMVQPKLGEVASGTKRYMIGIAPDQFMHVDKLPFPAAIDRAYSECRTNSILIFELVGKMIQGKGNVRQVSGPIMIGKISGQAAMEKGWTPLLIVMAIISLNLAVFNLFPIPILDGGLMLMLLIESVMRRDIKQEIKERVYQAAFVFLILFAVVVIYNDVAKNLPGLS